MANSKKRKNANKKASGKITLSASAQLRAIKARNNAGSIGHKPLLNNAATIIHVKVKPKNK